MANDVAVFNALGDKIRMQIVKRLSTEKFFTITQVTAGLPVTRQGARRHLQVLADAKVVKLKPEGRDVLVALNPQALADAKKFIAILEQKWDERLLALKNFVENK